MFVDLDTAAFGLRVHDWQIDIRGRSAGESLAGGAQVVIGAAPRWRAQLSFRTFERMRARRWRAFMARVRGRTNLVRLDCADPYRLSLVEIGLTGGHISTLASAGVTHSNGATFSNGAGYALRPRLPILDNTGAGVYAALAGASKIKVNGNACSDALLPGQMVSIRDFAYAVKSVTGTGTSMLIGLEPPLRQNIPAGSELDLNARTICFLAGDLEGAMAVDEQSFVQTKLELIEWVDRPW